MAKCPLCDSRKGKRKCLVADALICSLCCGQTRKKETCVGCPFYTETGSKRKYGDIPRYTTRRMEADFELQDYSNAIEGALCAFDTEMKKTITDDVPIRILELLLDKYYFKDPTIECDDDVIEKGFTYVDRVIHEDMPTLPAETLVKVLAVIHFVAKRRSRGGREYLTVINMYVGNRIASGVRALPFPD